MLKLVFFILLTLQVNKVFSLKSVSSHLDANDNLRLQNVFIEGIKSNDLQSVFYSSLNIELNDDGEKKNVCARLFKLHEDSKLNEFEKNAYLVGAHKNLHCDEKITKFVVHKIKGLMGKDASTAAEIYYNLYASKMIGITLDDTMIKKIAANLQNILKKDDSLTSLGYSFLIATELKSSAAFIVDRVEDAIVQADEVGGNLLQFEGGLSITALVLNGALKLTQDNKRPAPITDEQAVKFASYFLSRRSVQSAKGAHVLLESLKTLISDKRVSVICMQIDGNSQIAADLGVLNIKIVDLLGKPLSTPMKSISGKISLEKGNVVLTEQISFIPRSSDKTIYSADISAYKPKSGIYISNIIADNYTQYLNFRILGKVRVKSLEIGVGDSDSVSAIKKQSVSYPNKIPQIVHIDHTEKLVIKAMLTDDSTAKVISVQQFFVRFTNIENNEDIIFVAEKDTNKAYKFDMDVRTQSGYFKSNSGTYRVELIVGDSYISNSFQWHIGDIHLQFAQDLTKNNLGLKWRQPFQKIDHQFRQPDKRPPRFVSDIFTGLCLIPLFVLFIIWTKLDINVTNVHMSFTTIGFHVGFGSILGLFGIFWLKLNMFETIRYLVPLGIFTFFCGNRLLRSMAGVK